MSVDFTVIGAGALGLATAEALLRQGASVTVLDQAAWGRESSWAGGGILSPLCPWDYPDEVTRIALRGASQFGAWSAGLQHATGIDPEYWISGMLVKLPVDVQRATAWCHTHNVRFELKGGSIFLPEVAQVRNPRLLQALHARVRQLGGNIVEHCAVTGLIEANGKISALQTTQGELRAQKYVVTAGAWSRHVLGQQAQKLDVKPIRGQMLLFKFDQPPLPHIVLHEGLYLIPRQDGHLLVGSTLEDVGFDKATTIEARDTLRSRAEVILPELFGMPLIQHWSGLRPGSPGNLPTIGRHPTLSNLYVNSGHFRYGVTMAPASVEILLNEMSGSPQPFDVSPYRWKA